MNHSARRAAAILFAAACLAAAGAAPVAEAAAQQPAPAAKGMPKQYVEPKGRFVLSVPPGVQVLTNVGKLNLELRSQKGYVVNVQLAPTNRQFDLDAMLDRLESRYYGATKMWTAKLGRRDLTLGGLPAREAIYKGIRSQARVVVARGRLDDFVLMFLSDPNKFEAAQPEFNWILSSFRAAPAERPKGATDMASTPAPAPVPGNPPVAAPPPSTAVPAPPKAKESTIAALPADQRPSEPYVDTDDGFSINHPPGWTVARPAPFTVVLSGGMGSQAFYATVGIQNVQPPAAKSNAQVAGMIADDLKAQLKAAGAEISDEKPYFYTTDGRRLTGRQFVTVYDRKGRKYVQWTVVVPRPTGTVGHILTYSAPQESFAEMKPQAAAIMHSFRILEPAPAKAGGH